MAFSEFYCNAATGSNTNAGSTEGAPVATLTGGSWVSATGVFTKAASDLSGVSVGMFAAVMVDAGTVAAIVGLITAVDDTADTVTVSTTAKSGSLVDQAGTATLTVGGVWKGPNAAVAFPFGFVDVAMTNVAGDTPRVNLKNNAQYDKTATMTHAGNGPVRFQGYTTTVGDGGRATIDGGAGGASYTMLTVSGTNNDLVDLIFQNNGATGTSSAVVVSGAENLVRRCVANSLRGNGFNITGGACSIIECEAYACNQSNTVALAGFKTATGANSTLLRCISHDNAGSNSAGFALAASTAVIQCIADSNGGDGFEVSITVIGQIIRCDAYNNAGDGIDLSNTTAALFNIENCNLIKNGGYGINGSGAGGRNGTAINNAFGAGTQENTSGTTTGLKTMVESGSVNYASNVTPWVDPANGDFRINLLAAKGAGRGSFTQTAASYAGTVGYPDIGAAQHLEEASGGWFSGE